MLAWPLPPVLGKCSTAKPHASPLNTVNLSDLLLDSRLVWLVIQVQHPLTWTQPIREGSGKVPLQLSQLLSPDLSVADDGLFIPPTYVNT